jgi:hypothetical protein
LHVYQHGDDDGYGVRVAGGPVHDSLPSRLRKMNIANRRFWAARGEMP